MSASGSIFGLSSGDILQYLSLFRENGSTQVLENDLKPDPVGTSEIHSVLSILPELVGEPQAGIISSCIPFIYHRQPAAPSELHEAGELFADLSDF